MTTDQGTTGGAELDLSTLVTPTNQGLNPNANVFQSKLPNAPSAASSWEDSGEVTPQTSVIPTSDSYQYMNGDVNKLSSGTVFSPPASHSPVELSSSAMSSEYAMNGLATVPAVALPSAAATAAVATAATITNATSNTTIPATADPSSLAYQPPPLPPTVASVVPSPTPQQQDGGGGGDTTSGDESQTGEGAIPLDHLKALLTQQLEYYFSRENLANDSYLLSQMDNDQYVPIWTVANFNQIKKLTKDLNLIVDVLRESPNVQVDEAGEKVRPNHKRCIVILREIPESTPVEEVEALFKRENCPKFVSCEFAHNNSWYVTFDSDEDAQKAYRYLREEVKTFQGKSIMARIKAKPIARTSYMPKNGFRPMMDSAVFQQPPPPPQQQQQQQQQQPPQQQPPPQPQTQPRYMAAYHTHVPSLSYNSQQVQAVYAFPPFYPPNLLQTWGPTSTAYCDIGSVFSMNGLAPQAAYKPVNGTGRGSFTSRARNQKGHSRNQLIVDNRQDSRAGSHSLSGAAAAAAAAAASSLLLQQQQTSALIQSQQKGISVKSASLDGDVHHSKWDGSSNSSSSGGGGGGVSTDITAIPLVASHCGSTSSSSSSLHHPHSHQAQHHHHHHHQVTSALHSMAAAVATAASNTTSTMTVGTAAAVAASVLNQAEKREDTTQTLTSALYRQSDVQASPGAQPPRVRHRRKKREDDLMRLESSKSSLPTKETKALPKFDLEASSFPPLPGTVDPSINELEVFENRMSDVVKGTAKPSTRDTKTQTSAPLSPVSLPTTKESTTLTNGDALTTSVFTPPLSPITSRSSRNVVTLADKATKTDEFLTNGDDQGNVASTPPPPSSSVATSVSSSSSSSCNLPPPSSPASSTLSVSSRSSTTSTTPSVLSAALVSAPPSFQPTTNEPPTTPHATTHQARSASPSPTNANTVNAASASTTTTTVANITKSTSTISISDSKPAKLSYAQMAQRAKEKVEKIAQEQKEKQEVQERERRVREREIATVATIAKPNGGPRSVLPKEARLPRDSVKGPRDKFVNDRDRFRKPRTLSLKETEFRDDRDRRRDREVHPKSPK